MVDSRDLGRTGSSAVVGTVVGIEEEVAATDTEGMVATDTKGMVAADTEGMVAVGSTVRLVAVGRTVGLVDIPILAPADTRMDYLHLEMEERYC